MSATVSEILARPVRTAAQIAPAWVVVEFIDAFLVDLDDRQFAVSVSLLTLLIGVIQVAIENRTGHAFLRNVPPTKVPVTDEPGEHHPGLVTDETEHAATRDNTPGRHERLE